MKSDHRLTADALRRMVEYRDGALWWRCADHHAKRMDKPLGAPAGRSGRLQVQIGGAPYYVHRLIWLYHHGEWPSELVDHINGDPRDNRIENLRCLSNAGNCRNVDRRGVSLDRRKVTRPWRARIMVDGRSVSLGYYDTEDDAMAAYASAKRTLHPEWASGVGAT